MDWYEDRRLLVADLGFTTYREYLRSDLWKSIRSRVFEEKSRNCCNRKCQKKATCVHHEFYTASALEGSCIRYLWPLCDTCHSKVHARRKGKMVDLMESSRILSRMVQGSPCKKEKRKSRRKRYRGRRLSYCILDEQLTLAIAKD